MPETIAAPLGHWRTLVAPDTLHAPLRRWREILGIEAEALVIPPGAVDPNPTARQKEVGNYRKFKFTWNGLQIAIENPKGSIRSGTDREGNRWQSRLAHHYGYIMRVSGQTAPDGKDGDKVDVFLGPDLDSGRVFVVNQINPETKAFDEHKALLGFPTAEEARQAYLANYAHNWGGLGSMREMSVAEFKRWLSDGGTTLEAEFNPDQPRDDQGRWTSGGGGLSRGADKRWRDEHGQPVDATTQSRLDALHVPPAWTGVRINPDAKGDLQVIGHDAKGRAQYLYSAEHSERAAAEKFARLQEFNNELPQIRDRIAADLRNPNATDTEREGAAVLTLIDKTGFRVGSDNETGAEKQAYGASTLLAQHVSISGDIVKFEFVGKKGVDISKTVEDHALAQMLAPRVAAGGRLFDISDSQVRDYLHSRDGQFKVKDFRTMNGTVTALREIAKMNTPTSTKAFTAAQKAVAKVVAAHLGNTPTVALQSYIDPAVWGKWKAAAMR